MIERNPSEAQAIGPAACSQMTLRLLVLFICAIPLVFSVPSLGDPFGQTEEGVNAAIWALGGRNILEEGPVAASFGAKVAPYWSAQGGIYAHHPPLPVWMAALAQLPGTWEGWPRLVALLLAGAALFILFQTIRLFVENELAAAATAVVATCPYVLCYARMPTTLTLATPLFTFLLRVALLRSLRDQPWRWTFLVAIAAAVFSSWDGFLGAAAIVLYITGLELHGAYRKGAAHGSWFRALMPGGVFALAVVVLAFHLVWANGGFRELLGWAQLRMGMGENFPDVFDWGRRQIGYIASGVGWLTFALLVGVPMLFSRRDRPRGLAVALLLSAAPGVGMTVLFRNGAHHHAFWAYNLILPAAFAVALWLHAITASGRRAALLVMGILLGIQAIVGFRVAGDQLGEERGLNSVGALVRGYFAAHRVPEVKMLSAYDFHPYVSWYLRVPTEIALSAKDVHHRLASGEWEADDAVLIDTEFTRNLGCESFPVVGTSRNRRWVVANASAVDGACAP